tara:strand:+ start:162 stop:479 length:318 start_codon:yes stop_codon:yes gene_type:complete
MCIPNSYAKCYTLQDILPQSNKSTNKLFETVAVPAGLMCINNPICNPPGFNNNYTSEEKGIVDNALYNKLFELALYRTSSKTKNKKNKTRNYHKKQKLKTRRRQR